MSKKKKFERMNVRKPKRHEITKSSQKCPTSSAVANMNWANVIQYRKSDSKLRKLYYKISKKTGNKR